MCTKRKLEWIQVTETFNSLRACVCVCARASVFARVYMCVYKCMHVAGTPTMDLFKISLYADLLGRHLCQN